MKILFYFNSVIVFEELKLRYYNHFFLESGRKKWLPKPFHRHGVTFLLNVRLKSSVLFVWVSAVLSSAQATHYIAELQIGDKVDKKVFNSEFNGNTIIQNFKN